MIFKPYCDFETDCAGYLFGCGGLGKGAVGDAHDELIDTLCKAPPKPAETAQIIRINQGSKGSTE